MVQVVAGLSTQWRFRFCFGPMEASEDRKNKIWSASSIDHHVMLTPATNTPLVFVRPPGLLLIHPGSISRSLSFMIVDVG